jgi:hypothetical protein
VQVDAQEKRVNSRERTDTFFFYKGGIMRARTLAFTLLGCGLGLVSTVNTTVAEAPDPTFSLSCTAGGETVLSWKHVRVTQISLDWFNSSGALVAQTISTNPRGLRLSLPTPAPVDDGGRVEATLFFADGGGARLAPTACTSSGAF